MDSMDREILDRLQQGIPLVLNPFEIVSTELGLEFTQFQKKMSKLTDEGYISHLGPIYDTRKTGYKTTLMAMKCIPDKLDSCARVVASYAGVSHCYERENHFNLWSTLAVPPESSFALITDKMEKLSNGGILKTIFLPEVSRYKLRVNFKLSERTFKEPDKDMKSLKSGETDNTDILESFEFSENDTDLLKVLQHGFPCISNPFEALAEGSGFTVQQLYNGMKQQLERGFIRRVACLVKHRKAGYRANGMAVWQVNDKNGDAVGKILAKDDSVSHCYKRLTQKEWPYSHYAMIHGKSVDEVISKACILSKNANLTKPLILFSLKEYKKCRLKLYTDAYRTWPEGII